jgi:hypothetical protein
MAAALDVVGRAPASARPALQAAAYSAFGSGLKVACVVGAGVAVLGAGAAFRYLPGRAERVGVPAEDGAVEDPLVAGAGLPVGLATGS